MAQRKIDEESDENIEMENIWKWGDERKKGTLIWMFNTVNY